MWRAVKAPFDTMSMRSVNQAKANIVRVAPVIQPYA